MRKFKSSAFLTSGLVLGLLTGPAAATVITGTYVGTFSSNFAIPNDPSGVTRGGKYVVKSSFDTSTLQLVTAATGQIGINQNTLVAPLNQVPGEPGATNTYQLFLPTQGYGILTQTGLDHFVISNSHAQTAQIQFFNTCTDAATCAAQFRGFEFESNFLRTNSGTTPAATDLVFEQYTADSNLSGTAVTSYQVNLLNQALTPVVTNAGTLDVRSQSTQPAGGLVNPGVFFAPANPVVANAGGTPLVYSASQLSVTTNGGTALVTDTVQPIVAGQVRTAPSSLDALTRQADNDLGAGRTDREDFLSYVWTANGSQLAGNLSGTRLNRTVVGAASAPSAFANSGTRTVDNVNRTVAIQNSGLQTTVDTKTFGLTVTEAMTGLTDADSVSVRYLNALPTIPTARATAQVDDLLFQLAFADPDLAVNNLIPSFEQLTVKILVGLADFTGFFGNLIQNGSQLVDAAALFNTFGAGIHTFEVRVSDRAILASGGTLAPAASDFQFSVQRLEVTETPEPATLTLFAIAAVALAGLSWRRRSAPRLAGISIHRA